MKFDIGDRVITLTNGRYCVLTKGQVGTVRQTYQGNIAVELDDAYNGHSSRGYFYFNEKQLELLKGDDTTTMEGNYVIADVQFIEGSNKTEVYAYACYDSGIQVDDICVVKSAHHGFGLAKVVRLREKTDEPISREIVCKADFAAYNKRVENRKKRAELKTKMAKRASALQELAMYEILAAEDKEMAELLKAYKEVN